MQIIMGYDLHITRRKEWFSDEGLEITDLEWRTVVEADAEMRLTGAAELELPSGEALRYENPNLAEWTGHPDNDAPVVWFDYRDGNIVVKNPDEATIVKMQEIARKLGAIVQGDDGEIYS
jgi:hypothetical protein